MTSVLTSSKNPATTRTPQQQKTCHDISLDMIKSESVLPKITVNTTTSTNSPFGKFLAKTNNDE